MTRPAFRSAYARLEVSKEFQRRYDRRQWRNFRYVTAVSHRAKRVPENSSKIYAPPDVKNTLAYNDATYFPNLLSTDR
jgi:hypothetical protein